MRKFFILLTAGISMLTAVDANAYTVDQIVSECPYMIAEHKHQKAIYNTGYWGTYYVNVNVNVMRGYGLRLEKVDDTHLKFCGFEGKYDFVFTLTDTNGKANANGTQLRIDGMTANTNQDKTDNTAHYIYPIISTSIYQGAYNWNRQENFVLTVTKDNAGNFVFGQLPTHTRSGRGYFIYKWEDRTPFDCASTIIDCTFAPPAHYALTNSGYVSGYASDRFDDYKYLSSAAASDTAPRGAKRIRTDNRDYPVLVKWNETTGTFSIINFAAMGFGYNPTAQNIIDGTFKADGTCELSDENLYYRCNYGGTYGETGFEGYYATQFIPKSNTIGTKKVKGTWEAVDVKHNYASHAWVTNGGERRTSEGIELAFEPFTLLNAANIVNKYTNLKFDGGYFDTRILFGNDATVDVKLNLDKVGVDDQNILVTGSIVTNKNDMYVDHYELYAVPGHYSTINDEGFSHDLEHGHTAALNIHDAKYSYHEDELNAEPAALVAKVNAEGSAVGTHDYKFSRLIPRSDIASHPANHYTFFIKAVYKDDKPQLTPTFHDLQYRDINTGVEDLVADAAATVEAGHGVITIGGTDAAAVVYNASGATVYSGTDRTISVAAGLYIVKVGRTVAKVVVR